VRRDAVARGAVSPFEIILSVEERRELERRARCYTASYAVVVRAKVVLLAAEGVANVEIAARCDTSPQGGASLAETVLRQAVEGPGGRCS
jgi:hypothetical protein